MTGCYRTTLLFNSTQKVEDMMHDLIESLAICSAIAMIFMPLIGFVLFLRTIKRKEKAALMEFEKQFSNLADD